METSKRQKRRWLLEFGGITLAVLLVLGLVINQSLVGNIREDKFEAARQRAALVAKLGVEPQVTLDELARGLSARQVETLDGVRRASAAEDEIRRVTVRDRELKVVYAADRRLIGRTSPASSALAATLGGNLVSEVGTAPTRPGQPGGRVLKVFVPLRLTGSAQPVGVTEVWLPHAPIEAAVKEDSRGIQYVLFGLLFVLYATMLVVVALASKRLRRRAADKEKEALQDGLTGLPNRTLFHDLMARRILGARRNKGMVAVMLMDLDRFKEVNDTLGHHNGDLLLQRISTRLQGVLREHATIARLGGDEFGILLPDIENRAAVVQVAKRVLKALEDPVVVGGLSLRVEGSIGIAVYPEHGERPDSLIRSADVAMYAAKESRSGYQFYAAEHNRYDAGRLALVGELRRAMEDVELTLHYQPKVELATGQVKGVEALARWNHPGRGLIAPDEFIPLAERSSLLRPMTLYLVDTALRQATVWQTKGFKMRVAVNLSMQNLLDLQLPIDLDRLLSGWRLGPEALEFEITESTIMADPRRAMANLTRLNEMGFQLSVDDFGTGYSSLAYLKQLPVNALKIDKSFVMNMAEDEGNAKIVQSTIDLGHNLGLEVIAEGVESLGVYSQLAALGCDYAQGYFLSKPLPPEKMTVWLDVMAPAEQAAPAPEQRPTDPDVLKEWVIA